MTVWNSFRGTLFFDARSDRASALLQLLIYIASACGAWNAVPAATTTYTSAYVGGDIAPSDTVVLANGASVTGRVNVSGVLQFNQSISLTVGQIISGTGTLLLTNTGTTTLGAISSSTNTFSTDLGVTISSGRLNIGDSGTGTFNIGVSGTGRLSVLGGRVISGVAFIGGFYPSQSAGSATVSSGTWSTSALTVGGGPASNFAGVGTLTISDAGTAVVDGPLSKGAYGTINLNAGGTLQIGAGGTTGVLLGGTGSLVNNGTLIFNRSDTAAYVGSISGSGQVRKLGGGLLSLSGTNSYAGPTAVQVGILQFAQPFSMYSGSTSQWNAANLTTGSGATLALNVGGTGEFTSAHVDAIKALGTGTSGFRNGASLGLDTTNASSGVFTYTSGIANANGGANAIGLVKMGSGVLVLAGNNSYTGGTVIAAGILAIGTGGQSGSLIGGIANNAELAFDRAGLTEVGSVITGSGLFRKLGSGTVALTGNNSYLGGTVIAGGVLQIGTGGTNGWIVGNVTNNATLAFNRSDDVSYTGAITGTGAVTQRGAGRLLLSANNSYSGGTIVDSGTLVASGPLSFGGAPITVNQGTLDLNSHAVPNTFFFKGGSLVNAENSVGFYGLFGPVVMTGTVGSGIHVGPSGELKGTETVFKGPVILASGALHSPGNSPGVQTFTQGLSYAAGSVLNWELIANTTAGAGNNYDFLSVAGGSLSIESGALLNLVFSGSGSTVNWSDPFWSADRSWTIIDALAATSSTGEFTLGTVSNDFLGRSLLSVRPDAAFALDHSGNNVVLTFTAVPEPSAFLLAIAGFGLVAAFQLRQRLI